MQQDSLPVKMNPQNDGNPIYSSSSIAMARYIVCLIFLVSLINFLLLPNHLFGDWPQFRGNNSSGIYVGKSIPLEFGAGKNELWSCPISPGHSSPCLVGDNLFLTAFNAKQKKLEILCLDKRTGKTNWQREIEVKKFETGHPSFNPASSTVTADPERVVAYFGSFGLICFSKSGEKLWDFPLPTPKSYAGNATSPAIVGNKVILYRGNHVDHFVLALNKNTGKEIWRVPQEEPFNSELACTACPIVSGNKLILHTARSVQAIDIESGKQIWVAKCATTATSTPVLSGKEVIVAAWNKMGEPALRPKFPSFESLVKEHDKNSNKTIGRDEFPKIWIFHRPEGIEAPQNGAPIGFRFADENRDGEITEMEWKSVLSKLEEFRARYQTHGMLAIPIESQGLIDQSKIRVLSKQGIPEVPSPLIKDNLLYFVKNGGLLTCVDKQTGKRVYRSRTDGKGTHYASPIIANNHLLTFSGDGKVTTVQLGADFKILATNQLDDSIYATPAIDEGVLYIRTHTKIYAFGKE